MDEVGVFNEVTTFVQNGRILFHVQSASSGWLVIYDWDSARRFACDQEATGQEVWTDLRENAGAQPPSWHLSFLTQLRRMNHDAILLGNCSNRVDSRHVCGAFAGRVEGSEHAIEAGTRYREHQQVRRNGADIAIGVPSVARGKQKPAGAKAQWIGPAFNFDQHFAAQHIEDFVLAGMRVRWRAGAWRDDRFPHRELVTGIACHRFVGMRHTEHVERGSGVGRPPERAQLRQIAV